MNTPTWLKINRTGDTFSFYYSNNGLAWTSLGSQALVLPTGCYAEIFAGSGVATTTTTTFEQVCIQNLAPPTYTFSGLSPSTTYSLTAKARDIALNESAASATLSVTTNAVAVPAYTLRSVGTEAHGTSVTCGAPTGVAVGDLLLLRADCRNNADTFSTPAGWTKISPNTNVTECDLYARIATATGGDAPPTMASSGSSPIIVQMACFTGSVYTGGLGSIVHASVDKRGTNTGIPYTGLTVSLADCLIIACGSHNKSATSDGATVNSLSGFTQIGQQNPNGNSLSSWWGYAQQTTATNVSAVTQTRTGTAENLQYNSLYIALKTT